MKDKTSLPPTAKALLLAMKPGERYHELTLPNTPFGFVGKGVLVKRGLALRFAASGDYWNYRLTPEGEEVRAKILSEEGAK